MIDNIEETSIMYQWIKGDKLGNVEEIDKEDGEWTLFKSGGRIATSLFSEYLISVKPSEIMDFDDLKEPKKIENVFKSEKQETQSKVTVSPIRLLLNKQKKLDEISLTIELPIKMINKEVYDVLLSSFDEDEFINELYNYIIDQLSNDYINGLIKGSIDLLIKEYNINT